MIDPQTLIVATIAENLSKGLKDGDISLHDDVFIDFLPVLYARGNLEFLKVIAEQLYPDSRKDVIVNFLDLVMEWTASAKTSKKSKEVIHYGTD